MTNEQKVVEYLRSIHPKEATNADIRERTKVQPHQQVFQITQRLVKRGEIVGHQRGKDWFFHFAKTGPRQVEPTQAIKLSGRPSDMSPREFEEFAGTKMSEHYSTPLHVGEVPGVSKKFDYVSSDGQVVGDAKYFTMVRGMGLPPAKFSVIAEHVWLLEKTKARSQFLVFGNDRRVPLEWLARFGRLVTTVAFFFLTNEGAFEKIGGPSSTV